MYMKFWSHNIIYNKILYPIFEHN
uniref:Uncharacterized protein n=1 Tax=Lepeophtheirus salmonis TaxID=72036 RepID=A0A0K2VKM0_LEPSM